MRRVSIRSIAAVITLIVSFAGAPSHAATSCAPPSAGGDWPVYGHDLANTRTQPGEATIGTTQAPLLAPVWTFSSKGSGGDGDFTGTPVEAGGCVYVGSNMGWVYAINADDGSLVWKAQVPGGSINSSLGIEGDRVFAAVSNVGHPYVIAYDRISGAHLWTTETDDQDGADAFGSPVAFNGVLFEGVSGDAAQHSDAGVRTGFRGSFVLIDTATGEVLAKTYTISKHDWENGYAGATISATPAIDAATGYLYAGTTSAYVPQLEPPLANSLITADIDRSRETFGQIIASMKGDTFDRVLPGYSTMPCEDLPTPTPPAIVPTGRGVGACGDVDVDFASSPNLFLRNGAQFVGAAQKSGVYHAADTATMHQAWEATWGPAQPFGGVSTAYDGTRIIGGGAPPGYLYAVDLTGAPQWFAPVLDGAHYGIPVAVANGVAYTVDVKGFLDAYDTATGAPLLHRPIALGANTGTDPILSFAGVSVARNTVYAATGLQSTGVDFADLSNGYVVAFRPFGLP